MKIRTIFIASLILPLLSYGQEISKHNWILSFDYGIQKHDKRLFKVADKEFFLEENPEYFGTYQYGVRVERKIYSKKMLLFVGLGISFEVNNFRRPFDHFYERNFPQHPIRASTHQYYKSFIQVPFKSYFWFKKKLAISAELLPQISYSTIVKTETRALESSIEWKRFDFHSVEFNTGIVYNIKRLEGSLKFRLLQIKRIDPIFFGNIINDPRINKKNEMANPFKFWISIGYRL